MMGFADLQGSISKKVLSKPTANSSSASLVKITILVVDDDSTSLAIVSAMLKEWRYEVATVKTPVDALSTLRAYPGFDLVVTDLHMPEMNGIELQKQINREFKLPVIIMSSDDKESVILKSLGGGAVFYMVKPVNLDDLKNVWQYAIVAKKGKSVVSEEIGCIEEESSSSAGKLSNSGIVTVSSVQDENNNAKRGCKRMASKKGKGNHEEEETASNPKKAKVVWTNSLHNQFLEALRYIGMERAVPKKILELMNVQGLTRENVASHLQKYRIFLKRVAERSYFSSKALAERVLKSSFASGHPLLLKTAQEYSRLAELQKMRGLTFRPGYGGSSTFSSHNAYFPSQINASSSSINFGHQQHGYGQSLSSGNTNPLYQSNYNSILGFANGSNLSLNGGLSSGSLTFNASNGLMNGANSVLQRYQQQFQARPNMYNNAGSSSQYFRFGGSPTHHSSNPTPNNGNISNIYPTLHSSTCTNNNDSYAGVVDQTRINGGYDSRTNGACNENMNIITAMGNQNFRYMAQGAGSPASAGLGGINQVSLAYSIATTNQQVNSSWLPGLGNGDNPSDYNHGDHHMNIANITLSQQFSDQGYLSDLVVESNNYKSTYHQQQAGGEGVLTPEIFSSSMFPEIYPSLDQLLNSDFSDSLPNCEQTQGQQQSGGEQSTDSELGSSVVLQKNNDPASGDDSFDNLQNWGEDFLDSLFSFGPDSE